MPFQYFNYLGIVPQEFGLNPEEGSGWENDSIEWFTLEEIDQMMKSNPGDFHPGLIELFKNSRGQIEQALGIKQPPRGISKKEIAGLKPLPEKIAAFLVKRNI
jgi:hypothetical protein